MLLNCHTYYSLCYGTLSVEELLEALVVSGHEQFVVADINNTTAVLETLRLCKQKKSEYGQLTPSVGVDFRNGLKQQYVAIAKNNKGYREINEHLSHHLHNGLPFDCKAPALKNAYVIYPLANYTGWELEQHEFIGVAMCDLTKLPFSPYKNQESKMVILQPATFLHKQHFNAHRLLRAIDKNTLLSKLPKTEQTSADEMVPQKDELTRAFAEFPAVLRNTKRILDDCSVDFEFGKLAAKNLKYYSGDKQEDLKILREQCELNLSYRYPEVSDIVTERLEKELSIIEERDFAAYFLINWDITSYARSKGYFYVGRGSGANSIVAYLLRITDVDPVDLDLYFERFINIHRANAPDFDIDFSWTDRDDIMRYIFEKFSRNNNVALLATYSTFQHDGVMRELGKVFGLPPDEIDKLQSLNDEKETSDSMAKLVLRYSRLIAGFPSHLSIHASGIIISEEPVTAYTATFLPPKGYPTTQFSMLEAEDIGLFKFDILSQRGLGKIKDAVDIVKRNKGIEIDIHDIKKFKSDTKVKELLRVGKCIGCFYVESPAMRMLLAKLQADDYLRLVAASSIIRPGVAKSGMMREYILRYRDEARRNRAEQEIPILYDILRETYGVMVYQEDVIKIAHIFADLTLAEADHLRRGMSWKFKQRNEFHLVRKKFFDNCRNKGYQEQTILDIWTQIESFANFAFSKGHSASYAVESYQALYLKSHYPLEYMVATINNGGGFYRREVYIHEARMHGANIQAPCVNHSEVFCTVNRDSIYLGFSLMNGVEESLTKKIVRKRDADGEYTGLYNFLKRTGASLEQLRLLIRIGAFRTIKSNKKELLWEAHMMLGPLQKEERSAELFETEPETFELPQLVNSWLDDAHDEIEILGFPLCNPFSLLKEPVVNTITSQALKEKIGMVVEIAGYYVSAKNTRTSQGARMYFGTFLDVEGFWIDTVHFPDVAAKFPFTGPGCYHIKGKVVSEFDFISIEVIEQHRLPMISLDDVTRERLSEPV